MADVKRKFVYRVSSGEVVTESLETSDDDSISNLIRWDSSRLRKSQ